MRGHKNHRCRVECLSHLADHRRATTARDRSAESILVTHRAVPFPPPFLCFIACWRTRVERRLAVIDVASSEQCHPVLRVAIVNVCTGGRKKKLKQTTATNEPMVASQAPFVATKRIAMKYAKPPVVAFTGTRSLSVNVIAPMRATIAAIRSQPTGANFRGRSASLIHRQQLSALRRCDYPRESLARAWLPPVLPQHTPPIRSVCTMPRYSARISAPTDPRTLAAAFSDHAQRTDAG